MPSRDRLRVCAAKQAFEQALESYLADHEELHRLNRERRDDELRGRLADDGPLTEALRHIIDASPELRELFRLRPTLDSPDAPGEQPEPFIGLEFPTFFRLARQTDHHQPFEVRCPLGATGRVVFETDAENDYFTRAESPGTMLVTPSECFGRVRLRDGRAVLVLHCPEGAGVGVTAKITVEITDPSRTEPFRHYLKLVVVEPRGPGEDAPKDHPPRSGAFALPKIVEVTQEDWSDEDFGPESGLAINRDIDDGLVAKVNVDNSHLTRASESASEAERELERKRFVYGLVLAGVALWQQYTDREDQDELVRSSTAALGRVLLPTIRVFGALERDSLVTF